MTAMSTKVTLDRAGRVALPKSLRDAMHLCPGDTLDLTVKGDELTLRPRRSTAPLQKERGVWVLRTGQALTTNDTEATRRATRTQRRRQNATEPVKVTLDGAPSHVESSRNLRNDAP
jgi:AbrB family looped-hinge helix DNA binding protein